jgi:hypothetical protein
MKTKAYLSGSSGTQRFAFVAACLLVAGAGWYSMNAVDRLGQMADELGSDFSKPSQAYLWNVSRRHKAPAVPASPRLKPVSKENAPNSSDPD